MVALMIGVLTFAALFVDMALDGFRPAVVGLLHQLSVAPPGQAGILSAWVGSTLVMLVTAFFAVPLGVAAGVYLEEYAPKNWVTDVIEINITNLAGVPSIVYGLLALGLFRLPVRPSARASSAAGLTLALLILPVVIVATREAIRSIPQAIREGSYALGATQWQTVRYHILPYSSAGILTGVIIGMARAIGETAPIITIGALTFIAFLPPSPVSAEPPFLSFDWLMSPFTVMPIQMFNWTSRPGGGVPRQRRRRRLRAGGHDARDERPRDLAALSPAAQHQMVEGYDVGTRNPHERTADQGRGAQASASITATFSALKSITMPVHERKVTALIGPSGCGKSTFLRCFNRMHDLYPGNRYEGEIVLHPDNTNLLARDVDPIEVRMRIGMVFQKPNPFPKSVFENVAYGLRVRGETSRRRIEEKVEQALQDAALWDEVKDRLHQPAYNLSGGQQQRLCIARALATDPEMLLFDEPTSALDPIATASIEELMHDLKERVTILIVTHNMQQAARVSDFTAYMYLGDLIEFGVTDELFIKPKMKQTEDYITGRFG